MTTLGSNSLHKKARTVLVAGRGAAATAVVDAVAVLPGIGCVRQVADFEAAKASGQLAGADVMIEMLGGVTPAFNTAMQAMGQGMGCITANPLLVAAHGRVLMNAAQGQHTYFGFQAAGFGMPVSELMAAARPEKVTVSFKSAASMALARMNFRNESLGTVSAHLKMQQVDLSDWGGKVTQMRALALRALWMGGELRGQQLPRVGVEQVEPADVRRLREFGLQPVYGAEITEESIYTGPMAVGPGSALLSTWASGQDVLVAETVGGEIVLTHQADDVKRVVAGVVADLRQYLRAAKPATGAEVRPYGRVAAKEPVRMFVRMPYAVRERLLALKPEIITEKVDADGRWMGVVAVDDIRDLQLTAVGGMVYPIAGAWDAPVVNHGLRLVS